MMQEKHKQYRNIYFVISFIGFFSLFYMLSFVFVVNDIQNGSSSKIKKEKMQKLEQEKNTKR